MTDLSACFVAAACRSPALQTALESFRTLAYLEDPYVHLWTLSGRTTVKFCSAYRFPSDPQGQLCQDWSAIMLLVAIVLRTSSARSDTPPLHAYCGRPTRDCWRSPWSLATNAPRTIPFRLVIARPRSSDTHTLSIGRSTGKLHALTRSARSSPSRF